MDSINIELGKLWLPAVGSDADSEILKKYWEALYWVKSDEAKKALLQTAQQTYIDKRSIALAWRADQLVIDRQNEDNRIALEQLHRDVEAKTSQINNNFLTSWWTSSSRSQSAANAVSRMTQQLADAYERAKDSKDLGAKRAYEDMATHMTALSTAFNDKYTAGIQDMVKNIQTMDVTWLLDSADWIIKAKDSVQTLLDKQLFDLTDHLAKMQSTADIFKATIAHSEKLADQAFQEKQLKATTRSNAFTIFKWYTDAWIPISSEMIKQLWLEGEEWISDLVLKMNSVAASKLSNEEKKMKMDELKAYTDIEQSKAQIKYLWVQTKEKLSEIEFNYWNTTTSTNSWDNTPVMQTLSTLPVWTTDLWLKRIWNAINKWQCWAVINDFYQKSIVWDTYQSKIDPKNWAKVWYSPLTREQVYPWATFAYQWIAPEEAWHVGWVTAVNADWTFEVFDSNRKWDAKSDRYTSDLNSKQWIKFFGDLEQIPEKKQEESKNFYNKDLMPEYRDYIEDWKTPASMKSWTRGYSNFTQQAKTWYLALKEPYFKQNNFTISNPDAYIWTVSKWRKDIEWRIANLQPFLDTMTKLINLAKVSGSEFSWTENWDAMATFAKSAQLRAKELYNLWVLNWPDLSLMETLIPSADDWGSFWKYWSEWALAKKYEKGREEVLSNLKSEAQTLWLGLTLEQSKKIDKDVEDILNKYK